MAEAVVSAVLTVLFQNISNKLESLFRNGFRSIQGGLSQDVERLSATLSKFQHVLQDAEVKDFKSAATRDWLRRLKYAANQADGILDDAMDSDSDSDDDNQTRIAFTTKPNYYWNWLNRRAEIARWICYDILLDNLILECSQASSGLTIPLANGRVYLCFCWFWLCVHLKQCRRLHSKTKTKTKTKSCQCTLHSGISHGWRNKAVYKDNTVKKVTGKLMACERLLMVCARSAGKKVTRSQLC